MSFLNGLSALGQGVSEYAGRAGLEYQRADLARQSAILVDQLGRASASAGRQESGQIAATAAGLQREHETGQLATQTGSAQKIAGMGAESAANVANIGAKSHLETTTISANAPTPEIKIARFLSDPSTTAEQKAALVNQELIKSGMPLWATGPGSMTPTPSAPGGTAGQPFPSVPVTPKRGPEVLPGDTSDITSGGIPGVAGPRMPDVTAPKSGDQTKQTNYNESSLSGMPSPVVSMVKAMVDGRIAPPSSFAASKPYWQALLAKAMEYDPTFDETTWSGRVNTRKDFTGGGKDAQVVNALNTALGHAGRLLYSFNQQSNFGGILGSANPLINGFQEHVLGDTRQRVTKQDIDALASEARKVFAGAGGGSLEELKEWQRKFNVNARPDQMRADLGEFVSLLDSRMQSLADSYNRGMGRTSDPISLLNAHAREVYTELKGGPPSNATGYQLGVAPPPTSPSVGPRAPAVKKPMSSYDYNQGTR